MNRIAKVAAKLVKRVNQVGARALTSQAASHILFIVGCQRSGTTLLTEIFENDQDAKIFGEFSRLSIRRAKAPLLGPSDRKYLLRWKEFDEVAKVLAKVRQELTVTKPLVESQRVRELLDYFPGSRSIWLYRDFVDVASSNIVKFGEHEGGVKNLLPIVDEADHWISEGVTDELRELVRGWYSPGMSPYDAAALFWLVRNRLYFDLDLEHDERVYLCRYENLVTKPAREMFAVYRYLGVRYPGDHIVDSVHSGSMKKGKDICLSAGVRALCQELQDRMDFIHKNKSEAYYSNVCAVENCP